MAVSHTQCRQLRATVKYSTHTALSREQQNNSSTDPADLDDTVCVVSQPTMSPLSQHQRQTVTAETVLPSSDYSRSYMCNRTRLGIIMYGECDSGSDLQWFVH